MVHKSHFAYVNIQMFCHIQVQSIIMLATFMFHQYTSALWLSAHQYTSALRVSAEQYWISFRGGSSLVASLVDDLVARLVDELIFQNVL